MREIKFRAWGKESKKMHIVSLMNTYPEYLGQFPKGLWAQTIWLEGENVPIFHCDKDELMQYTGLLDKNGKEIYEGDILRSGMRRGYSGGYTNDQVVWGEKSGEWLLADLKTGEKMQMQNDPKLREVIGNIYENGELLKK